MNLVVTLQVLSIAVVVGGLWLVVDPLLATLFGCLVCGIYWRRRR